MLDLSKKRAQAVRDFLVQQGIDPSRLYIEGYGPTHPAQKNTGPEGRAYNRRVQFNSFSQPDVYEGVRQVPVDEIQKEFQTEKDKKSSYYLYSLGRLYQVAFARHLKALPVETWSDGKRYSWLSEDPAQEPLGPVRETLSPQERERYLDQAIHYFSKVIKVPRALYIGGLPDYPTLRNLNAYRGLIWCYQQKGEAKKAQKLFPQYLKTVQILDEYPQKEAMVSA